MADATAEVFAQKVKELINIGNVNIIDKAHIPGYRIGPNISLIVMAGAFLGLLTALGIVFLVELRDDTLETVGDMETQVDLPVLGTIPRHIT
jgi:capsular polysaccharide biosynthesis protein